MKNHAGRKEVRRPSQTDIPNSLKIAAVAIVIVVLAWLFWPSPLRHVRNLDSRGSAIIAFGDSLTAGYGAASGEDYPAGLARVTDTEILNAGVSGDTTESALARVEQDVLMQDPRIVLVGLGGNDYLRGVPIEATEANLRTIIRSIQDEGAMVVVLGFRFPGFRGNYEEMYERVAEEERCLLIPDLLDGILSRPELKSDAIHPNGRGYQLMAERVAEPFEDLLERADREVR